ncbi:MAG: hypothetical protein JNL89_01415 [Rhodanobacteraceae bacterium]|nr:hypothetical protein [Rhodanobacteraceae bacterium]
MACDDCDGVPKVPGSVRVAISTRRGRAMSKGMNQKKETKKQPAKTAKEKKAEKREKKAAK